MAQEETFRCKQETQTAKFIFYRKKDVYLNKLHNKKHRRLISLALALVMMFSFMAMSASAAAVEVPVVQPRAACEQCGGSGFSYKYSMEEVPDSKYYTTCQYKSTSHLHYKGDVYLITTCRTCQAVVHSGYAAKGEKCTYNGKVWL